MKNQLVKFIIFTYLFTNFVLAQDSLESAKSDVKQLSSKEFAGRGFTFDGNKKAGTFLKERYHQIGIEKVNEKYGQPFDIKLNIVKGLPSLSINHQPLIIGKDFLPNSLTGSGSVEGETPIYYVKLGLYLPD